MSDTLKYDKTFRAKILEIISNKKCKVLYRGKEYFAKCDDIVNVDDMVWVCAPGNDWNELYIYNCKRVEETISSLQNYEFKEDGIYLDRRKITN